MTEKQVLKLQKTYSWIYIGQLLLLWLIAGDYSWFYEVELILTFLFIGCVVFQMKYHRVFAWQNYVLRGDSLVVLSKIMIIVWGFMATLYLIYKFII